MLWLMKAHCVSRTFLYRRSVIGGIQRCIIHNSSRCVPPHCSSVIRACLTCGNWGVGAERLVHSVRCYCLSKVASPSLLHKVSDKAHTETLCHGGRMRKRDTVNPRLSGQLCFIKQNTDCSVFGCIIRRHMTSTSLHVRMGLKNTFHSSINK